MTTNIQYEVPTWNQIYDMLLNQAQKMHNQNYRPDLIVGISRGGLIPARILSDLTETAGLSIIQIAFYTDIAKTNPEPTLKQGLTTQITGKKVLLVDDIADTGKCLHLARQHLQKQGAAEIKTATLYFKPESITVPDFYEKKTDSWIVFPWDTKETLRKIRRRPDGKRVVSQEVAKLVKAGLPKQLADKLLSEI